MNCNFIISDISYGGGRSYLEKILEANIFDRVNVFSIRANDNERIVCDNISVNLYRLGFTQIMSQRSDVTIINSQGAFWRLFLYLFFIKNAYYVTHGYANGLKFQSLFRRILFILALNFPFLKIVCCGLDELSMVRNLTFGKKPILVRNGIDFSLKFENRNNFYQVRKLGFFGRLSFQKGFDLLIESAAQLNLPIVAYGDWESQNFKNSCLLLAKQRSVNIDFRGYKTLENIDLSPDILYVSPSRFEGLPFAPLEFSLRNIPLILSDCPGNMELVCKSCDSLFFESGRSDSLTTTIASISEDILVKSLNIRNSVCSKYNVAQFKSDWLKCLNF